MLSNDTNIKQAFPGGHYPIACVRREGLLLCTRKPFRLICRDKKFVQWPSREGGALFRSRPISVGVMCLGAGEMIDTALNHSLRLCGRGLDIRRPPGSFVGVADTGMARLLAGLQIRTHKYS